MKLLFFLSICNIIIGAYLAVECVSIKETLNSLKSQQDTIQILASNAYSNPKSTVYVKTRNPKLKGK